MRAKADWIAWSLQFGAGALFGALFGFVLVRRLFGFSTGGSLSSEKVALFAGGMALVWGALASRLGDRLWLGSDFRIIPPDEVSQSHSSRFASIILGVLGGILALAAIGSHFLGR